MDGTGVAVGGKGGRVQCVLNVTSGQTLYITVGKIPTNNGTAVYNASDIRIGGQEYTDRVIVAGGGSSYTHPDLCSEVVHTQGFQSGNGYITISMV